MKFISSLVLSSCLVCAGAAGQNGQWKTVTADSGHLSIRVPSSWIPLDPTAEKVREFAQGAAKLNSNLAISQEEVKQMIANKTVKLFVFAKRDPETQFSPNVNIIMLPNDEHYTLDQLVSEDVSDMKKMGTVFETGRLEIDGRKAGELQTKISAGAKGMVIEDMFLVPRSGYVYQLTFSIPQHLFAGMKPTINKVAKSFKVR